MQLHGHYATIEACWTSGDPDRIEKDLYDPGLQHVAGLCEPPLSESFLPRQVVMPPKARDRYDQLVNV